mmetsp:Transcript_52331/g.103858  ORF Transcript_52331/g.103858 Transcript_52331/m.103858 type:complete len:257 (-) Transcript_52331:54-824(-)
MLALLWSQLWSQLLWFRLMLFWMMWFRMVRVRMLLRLLLQRLLLLLLLRLLLLPRWLQTNWLDGTWPGSRLFPGSLGSHGPARGATFASTASACAALRANQTWTFVFRLTARLAARMRHLVRLALPCCGCWGAARPGNTDALIAIALSPSTNIALRAYNVPLLRRRNRAEPWIVAWFVDGAATQTRSQTTMCRHAVDEAKPLEAVPEVGVHLKWARHGHWEALHIHKGDSKFVEEDPLAYGIVTPKHLLVLAVTPV